MAKLGWKQIVSVDSKGYKCGHCDKIVASDKGLTGFLSRSDHKDAFIYICPFCTYPTFFNEAGVQIPGAAFGDSVSSITDESVEKLYGEARRAMSAGSYTAAILCCRKLLMHIAVSQGAKQGGNFISYVEYLSDHHYVPPGAKAWVDHIRAKGNEANHEILIMPCEDAEQLLSFIEMLLKMIYEFPAAINQRIS